MYDSHCVRTLYKLFMLEDDYKCALVSVPGKAAEDRFGNVDGAPLKPWELARGGQRPDSPPETSVEHKDAEGQGVIHTTRPTPAYTPRPYYNSTYSPPYTTTTHSPYGSGSYYGYPSTYGTTGLYGTQYGSGYGGGTQYGTGYGGMYNYVRPSPWSHQPHYPGMTAPPGGVPQKTPMWQRFLDALHKIVTCFGRVTFLVDESTQAFHFLITALLTFLDKAGSLYGEIARYILKLLGFGRHVKATRRRASTTDSHKSISGSILRSMWKKQ